MKLQRDVGRVCGECNACCKPFLVLEVGKNDSGWCPRCDLGRGCRIYPDRPLECRQFTCMWLNGIGDEHFRPDRLGVMMDVKDIKLGDRVVGELHFWEMRTGAFDQDLIQQTAEANKDAGFILVCHYILTETTYDSHVSMRRDLFSSQEVEMYQRGEAKDCPSPHPML